MATRLTKKTFNIMFGPATDWKTLSVGITSGRQYTLDECRNQSTDGGFNDILKASQGAKNLGYDEIDRIEVEMKQVIRGILDLQEGWLWKIRSQGMIIQEVAIAVVQIVGNTPRLARVVSN